MQKRQGHMPRQEEQDPVRDRGIESAYGKKWARKGSAHKEDSGSGILRRL